MNRALSTAVVETEATDPPPFVVLRGTVTERVDQNPARTYVAKLAPGSRRAVGRRLEKLARMISGGRLGALDLPWHELRCQHTQALRAELSSAGLAVGTVNAHLSALRGCLKQAWRLGYMEAEDYHRAADVEKVRGETLPRGRALDVSELRELFRVCRKDAGPAGLRDAALIATLYGGGLRRAECISLTLEDYDADAGTMRVRGKGQKERLVHLPPGTCDHLARWLAVRGSEIGPLLLAVSKGKTGRILHRGISSQALYAALRRRQQQAGLKEFSPHDLRRSYVSNSIDAGADISSIQKNAGHANIQTTLRYDRRPEAAKAKAAGLLFVPCEWE